MIKIDQPSHKDGIVRKALASLTKEAILAVRKAEHEPNLKGDLRDLMKKVNLS